jgi:hypothetical protein
LAPEVDLAGEALAPAVQEAEARDRGALLRILGGGVLAEDNTTRTRLISALHSIARQQRQPGGAWRSLPEPLQRSIAPLMRALEREVLPHMVSWLPHFRHRGAEDFVSCFAGGLGSNSSVSYDLGLRFYESGWRENDTAPAGRGWLQDTVPLAHTEASRITDMLRFIQFTDRDLLSSAVMAELRAASSRPDVRVSLALRALGLISQTHSLGGRWRAVFPALSPGLDVFWFAARERARVTAYGARPGEGERRAAADAIYKLAVDIEETLRNAHGDPESPEEDAQMCARLSAEIAQVRGNAEQADHERKLGGTRQRGDWSFASALRRPSELVLYEGVREAAEVIAGCQFPPATKTFADGAAKAETRISSRWLRLRRVQAFTRNCVLLFVSQHPEYFHCRHEPRAAVSSPQHDCTAADKCLPADCEEDAGKLLNAVKQELKGRARNLARVLDASDGDKQALLARAYQRVAQAAREGARGMNLCACGPNNQGWSLEEGEPPTKGARLWCAQDCRPRTEAEPAVAPPELVGWPQEAGGEPGAWTQEAADVMCSFMQLGGPESAKPIRSLCQAMAEQMAETAKAIAAGEAKPRDKSGCTVRISEDGMPWNCFALKLHHGPRAAQRRGGGAELWPPSVKLPEAAAGAGEPPASASTARRAASGAAEADTRTALRCFYLRFMSGFEGPASATERAEFRERVRSRATCRALLDSPRSESDGTLAKAAIAASMSFADAVMNPEKQAKRKAGSFLDKIACVAHPLSPARAGGKDCVMQTLTEPSQLGAGDTGCSASFSEGSPYLLCRSQKGAKTRTGLQGVHGLAQKARSKRCAPAKGGLCAEAALPSQACEADLAACRKSNLTQSPALLDEFVARLLAAARGFNAAAGALPRALPKYVEIGNPSVVFLQPRNCAEFFRAAPAGRLFAFGVPADPQDSELAKALAGLTLHAVMSSEWARLFRAPADERVGICSGVSAARGHHAMASTCQSRSPGRRGWYAWSETPKYTELAGAAVSDDHGQKLMALAARMDDAGLVFALREGSSILVREAQGEDTSAARVYLRPFVLALGGVDASRTKQKQASQQAATYLGRSLAVSSGDEHAAHATVDALLHDLHSLLSVIAAARGNESEAGDSQLLIRLTPFAERLPADNLRGSDGGPFWASSFMSSLHTDVDQRQVITRACATEPHCASSSAPAESVLLDAVVYPTDEP